MIIDELNRANVDAMRAHDSVVKNIIGIVKNKYMLVNIEKKADGETADDADMIAIIIKTMKELKEESDNYLKVGNIACSREALKQRAFIERFMPKMMTEKEITEEIVKLEDKTLPSVMKHFKANFSGKCDLRLVGEITNKLNS